jgi:ATP-dependent Clp protease ATP-binding subunit ClpC
MDASTFETMLKAVSLLTLGEVTESLIPTDKIFSPATQHVVQLGEAEIKAINFDFLGTEGLLLGLLAAEDNLAGRVLRNRGVTFEVVQPLVAKWLGVRPEPPQGWRPPQLPLAMRARRVIELAQERAEAIGKPQITPEHLLLGILDEAHETGGGIATHILKEELGVDLNQLAEQLEAEIAPD